MSDVTVKGKKTKDSSHKSHLNAGKLKKKLSKRTMNEYDEEILRLNKKIKQLIWSNEQSEKQFMPSLHRTYA